MGFFDFLTREKRFSAKELRDIQEIVSHRDKSSSKRGSVVEFFKEMRELQAIQREMQQEKENEIQEIIENYAPDDSNGQALKMFGAIANKFMNANPNMQGDGFGNPQGPINVTDEPLMQEGTLDDAAAKTVADNIKKHKNAKLKDVMPELKEISGADFEKIKKYL